MPEYLSDVIGYGRSCNTCYYCSLCLLCPFCDEGCTFCGGYVSAVRITEFVRPYNMIGATLAMKVAEMTIAE
jgi:hypothetical protein